jgi:hypothetical protein
MCPFKSAWVVVASPFGTRASAHPPSLVQGRGKYRLSRWHPNGSRPGIATIFRIAPAIRSTGEDASDQSLRKPSRDENAKSFGEGERPQWSTSVGSGSLRDQAVGGRSLGADSLGAPRRDRTTKPTVEPYGFLTGRCHLQNRYLPTVASTSTCTRGRDAQSHRPVHVPC